MVTNGSFRNVVETSSSLFFCTIIVVGGGLHSRPVTSAYWLVAGSDRARLY